MEDTAKYLIHANVTADGVVERSDVVGAVFGQTEGLLGTEMDLRKLQESSKVGRIDVDVESERGSSFGTLTIATSLDRAETAVLAAALETISRVGPCRAEVEVSGIEDVRAAKRRDVVDRAKELMSESFHGSMLSTQEILEEVRRSVRVEDVTEYEGLPAGPHVGDSDAIIVVEGRSDVVQLLQYGIKNAIAVEGTDVPDVVGDLTQDRTVTAFFDGDRGGDLILKELAQIGEVDYVALAPPGRSVEELTRREVTESLREKMPYEVIAEGQGGIAATDGSVQPAPAENASDGPATPGFGSGPGSSAGGNESPPGDEPRAGEYEPPEAGDGNSEPAENDEADSGPGDGEDATADAVPDAPAAGETQVEDAGDAEADDEADAMADDGDLANADASTGDEAPDAPGSDGGSESSGNGADARAESAGGQQVPADGAEGAVAAGVESDAAAANEDPSTLPDHVRDVIGAGSGSVRLLDESHERLTEAPSEEAFDAIESTDDAWAVVLDGVVTQRVLDVAAQRGVAHVVARETGDFVKRPTSVRVRTADQVLGVTADGAV